MKREDSDMVRLEYKNKVDILRDTTCPLIKELARKEESFEMSSTQKSQS